jgi:integrase
VRGGSVPDEWNVFFGTPEDLPENSHSRIDEAFINEVLEQRRKRVLMPGLPYLLDPRGRPDPVINGYLAKAMRHGVPTVSGQRPRRLRPNSAKTYAYAIRTFLNILNAWDRSWRGLSEDDIDDVREWRLYAPDEVVEGKRRKRRVEDGTWERQVKVLRALYAYAARFGIPNPLAFASPGSPGYGDRDPGGGYVRSSNVKWFDPDAYRQWRDVGLGGLLPHGTENPSFRGRNVQRDMAFSDSLYRTGLRVQECGSVLLGLEWPEQPRPDRSFRRLDLSDACAKGGVGRPAWVPAMVTRTTRAYSLGERAAAVERGQAAYARQRGRLMIVEVAESGRLTLVDVHGVVSERALGALAPDERRRLFWDRGDHLEPAMLWLNRGGLPRNYRSWNRTFLRANRRVLELGLDLAPMKPHFLRHSFALRWFVVGRLLWDRRFRGLSEDEAADLRHEMGSHWKLVQTMLGHRQESTTTSIYLEPFQALDIELLLDHAADESVSGLMAGVFRDDPHVQSAVAL